MQSTFQQVFYAHDWSASPLGPVEQWPLQLGMTVKVMLDTPTPMFILWGPAKTFLFNEAFARILGERYPAAFGRSLPALWAESWDRIAPFVEQVFEGKGGLAEDVPLRTWASGYNETRCYTFSYTPVRALDGHVVGAIALCNDTTDRVDAERKLKSERSALLRLFQEAPGFIAMAEGPEHRFVFANSAYVKLVGREVVGLTVKEVLPEVASQGFSEILDQVFRTGERYRAHHMPVVLHPEGDGEAQRRFLDFVFEAAREQDGSIAGIIVQGHDVTEEVEAQERAQALQGRLIHLSRISAMGTMAATLAHELNQPLTAISNFVRGTQRLIESGSDAAALIEPLRSIERNSMRAGDIIRSLRKMTITGETRRQLVHLDSLVPEAAALAMVGGCEGISIRYALAEDMLVFGDHIQIQQVLINLIRNACQATEGRNRREVTVSTAASGPFVQLCVEDTGCGIGPEAFSELFDAFYSSKPEGMGIGLSISRTIVEAHGGTIWGQNRPEGGAAFCFTLPITDESGNA